MDLPPLIIETNPTPQDLQFLDDQINDYNMAQTGYYDFQWLAIFVHDSEQAIIAGITGFTWGGSCKINALWVQPNLRGQGVGKRLLETAEQEARARGCHVVVLESHSFQAPDFYQKLGYTVAGVRPDYPYGHADYFLYKRLAYPEFSDKA
jgi:ribosomal protein S18 acetylase RimI-like enzyme